MTSPTSPDLRAAILVLGCATSPYPRMLGAVRATWAATAVEGLDIFYLYGNPSTAAAREALAASAPVPVRRVADGALERFGDVLVAGCADELDQQPDCILRKRLLAFGYLAETGRYDFVYTTCAASYVDQRELLGHLRACRRHDLLSGRVGMDVASGMPYVSGASMLLSIDIARRLAVSRHPILAQNPFGPCDDVAICHWVATRWVGLPFERLLADLAASAVTPGHIIVPDASRTVDYVWTPEAEQRPVPGCFHYHFHSRRSDHMLGFHHRVVSG